MIRSMIATAGLAALPGLVACGDSTGNGDPTAMPTPLRGEEAVAAAAGVVDAGALLIATLLGATSLPAEGSAAGSAVELAPIAFAAGGGRRLECEWAGSVEARCDSRGATNILVAQFDGCEVGMAGQRRLAIDGRLRLETSAPLCELGRLPEDVPYDLQLRRLHLEQIAHDTGVVTESLRLDGAMAVEPTGYRCGRQQARQALAGVFELTDGGSGSTFSVSTDDLRWDSDPQSDSCPPWSTISGRAEIEHLARHLGVRFSDTRAQLARAGEDRTLHIDGVWEVDCLGPLTVQSRQPMMFAPGQPCAGAGELVVQLPGLGPAGIQFDPSGTALDFDDDGEVDASMESCEPLMCVGKP